MNKLALLIAISSICFGCGQNAPKNQKADMNNPVIETIMARRSIRHYTDQPVARELLQKIAECGVNAPNAMNRQQWDYFDGLTKVLDGTAPFLSSDGDPKYRNCLRNATAAIAVACPDDESGMCLVNVGLLCENICLAAKSFGLGSIVMAGPVWSMESNPDAKPFVDRLGFSEGYRLRIIVGLGYPDEDPEARPRDLGKIKFVD